MKEETRRLRIGVSACLLGEEVRYNGGHKRDPFLTDMLGHYVEWVPVCPEVEIGLGTPRPAMRLVRIGGDTRMIVPETGADHTDAMRSWADGRVEELAAERLAGFILKKSSPSCGLERVKLYPADPADTGEPSREARGLFAEALLRRYPDLPVEEEDRLHDPLVRESFLRRCVEYLRDHVDPTLPAGTDVAEPRPNARSSSASKEVEPTMRHKNVILALILALTALPAFAGVHYKSVTKTEDAQTKNSSIEVEGWVSGEKARVEFKESANPAAKQGSWLLTKDGGKTIYLVDPEEKTYAEWNLQAMLGVVGNVMQGMGPLLKIEFSDPKVEKLLDEDGGTVSGLPTRHVRYRTSYNMKIRVLGMGNEANVVTEQDIWATDRLQDVALGIWLRSDPPRTGNEQFDKLIAAEAGKTQGFPLKTVTVSTSTQKKNNKQTVTRSTMEVTQLDTSANVPGSSFEIPAGFKETQLMPTAEEGEGEEGGGLGSILRRNKQKKSDGGDGL